MPGAYLPNPDFEREISGQDENKAALKEAADTVASRAETMTPRIMPRNSEAMEVSEDEDGVAVVNTDFGGHLAEWGSRNNQPFAPLRRGVRSAGYRLEESSK